MQLFRERPTNVAALDEPLPGEPGIIGDESDDAWDGAERRQLRSHPFHGLDSTEHEWRGEPVVVIPRGARQVQTFQVNVGTTAQAGPTVVVQGAHPLRRTLRIKNMGPGQVFLVAGTGSEQGATHGYLLNAGESETFTHAAAMSAGMTGVGGAAAILTGWAEYEDG